MDEAPFIERRFEFGDDEVVARFSMPAKAPGGEFRCRWTITWPDRETRRHACGEDGVQALMLALRTVRFELVESDAYRLGKLTLWGQADLDLPPTWGVGPLYALPPRDGGQPR